MAQPLLDFLTGRARAALPFMRAAAAAGVKATNALDVLRAFGVGFQAQAFYDVYNALLGRAKLPAYLRLVPENVPLPYEAHFVNPAPQRNNYQYIVRVFHPPTQNEQHVAIVSDTALSQAQIFAATDELFAGETPYEVMAEQYPDAEKTILEASVATGVI